MTEDSQIKPPLPSVLNIKTDRVDLDKDIFCGRPSKWGNPFVIGRDGDRGLVIERFIDWFEQQDELVASLDELRGKNLVCYCAPHACHCDYLIRKANTETTASKKAYDKITPKTCKDNPKTLFVFGDNIEGWGKSGQSVIRGEPNTFGMPTKISPTVHMTDNHLNANKKDILWYGSKLERVARNYKYLLVIPNIGKGRADLPNKAPKTYAFLQWALSSVEQNHVYNSGD